jgi:hypothetical protein
VDWVKLLTEFDRNEKVLEVGLAGAGLYARALAYCGDRETDGAIPKAWVEQTVAREGLHDLPDQLVGVGLWASSENGYEIRDFTEVNRSKEEMDSLRESRSASGKRGGKAKPKQKLSKSYSYSNSKSSSSFDDWLEDYRTVTGRGLMRGSQVARREFAARIRDGYSLEDLKLATAGSHGDRFCREGGHDVPTTILRASKVDRYIELGRNPRRASASEHPADRRIREALEEAA